MRLNGLRLPVLAMLACTLSAGPALAVSAAACSNDGGGFRAWLESFKHEAVAQGISPKAVSAGLNGVTYDPRVIRHDRTQGKVFKQSFETFSRRLLTRARLQKGRQALRRYGRTLSQIERRYGVPGAVVVALWGLESNFGQILGKMSSLRSLATLSYDCRRARFFRGQLLDALRIVERGDLRPSQMRGAWAGEIGQTQFMPTSYIKYAVDFDRNGRADLMRSIPDVFASTANYLRMHGWRAGQPWSPGSANFQTLLEWNLSEVYMQTVAHFAYQIGGGERSAGR